MADAKALNQLKIKTNVVKRLLKEVESYKKEAEGEKAKIEAVKAKDPEAYELKKMNEQWKETLNMVPIIEKKIKNAHDDLNAFISQNSAAFQGAAELELANEFLQKSAAF